MTLVARQYVTSKDDTPRLYRASKVGSSRLQELKVVRGSLQSTPESIVSAVFELS